MSYYETLEATRPFRLRRLGALVSHLLFPLILAGTGMCIVPRQVCIKEEEVQTTTAPLQ